MRLPPFHKLVAVTIGACMVVTPSLAASVHAPVAQARLGAGASVGLGWNICVWSACPPYPVAAASPLVSVALEGRAPAWSVWTGLESQPTFVYPLSGDAYSVPMAMFSLGATFGSETLRIGPYGSIGLISLIFGTQLQLEMAEGERLRRAWEVRLAWLPASMFEVSVLYTISPKGPRARGR